MIAFIRARFTGTPAARIWSDADVANFMDPNVPYSLAHFWTKTSFGQFDLSYHSFAPVVLNDPRPPQGDNDTVRTALVLGVLKAVTVAENPDWAPFDKVFIWFAQGTDLFGGGSFRLESGRGTPRVVSAAVFDIQSGFDSICEEVGHAFGLAHELDRNQNEYGCPFSSMSAASELSFVRPFDARLPVGIGAGFDPMMQVGPYVPAVQMYVHQFGAFNNIYSVNYLSVAYEHTPQTFSLTALDIAIADWPTRRSVLAVIPPIIPSGDTYFLELRRPGQFYDQAIDHASVLLFAVNFYTGTGGPGRIHYVSRIDLQSVSGDLDFHSFAGAFVVRVNSVHEDFSQISLTVGGGDAWKDFWVDIGDPMIDQHAVGVGAWSAADVAPCPFLAKSYYSYRQRTYSSFVVFQAHSRGYEQPGYQWFLDDIELKPAFDATGKPVQQHIDLDLLCRDVTDYQFGVPTTRKLGCNYLVNQGRLEFRITDLYADIEINVRVTVNETSHEVMQNYYPERGMWTSIRLDNIDVEWDQAYQHAAQACWERMREFSQRMRHRPPGGIPKPGPPRERIVIELDGERARIVETSIRPTEHGFRTPPASG
ncbi:hypothetical protein ACFXHA_43485 [Nocardia sp. NPDC059240]|uniref:hypothetical protein n=1 Tax=Nocardia sp. NPDC059240 TaxID=3346786 RepID=UPI0036ADF7C1